MFTSESTNTIVLVEFFGIITLEDEHHRSKHSGFLTKY
jgi:hypothetical protein